MRLSSLAGPRGYWLGVAVAAIVTLPALGLGFFADDYLHLMTIEGASHIATPFDLFTFGRGDPEGTLESMKNGPYPWFMYPEFKAHFFRPLSSALMLLDHTLFGRFAPAYHVHSTLWHILLALGAMLILRRNFTPALGVLALFLFVLDDSHAFPVVWWSNRNAVVAVSLGFLGVAAHQRWREDAWKPGLPLSLLAFTGGLLAAEIGLSTMAYVLAYELFGARGTARRRFLCVLPAALLAIGYFIFYRLGDYGAANSDIYVDPGENPIAYLLVAPVRFIELAGAQFFAVPCELALLHPPFEKPFIALGVLALAVTVAALYWAWPRLEDKNRRALRWMLPGAAMASAPGLAAIVSSRVLLSASLGGAAVIAAIVLEVRRAVAEDKVSGDAPARWLRALAIFFIVVHLALAALSWPVQTALFNGLTSHLAGIIRNSEVDEDRIEDTEVVVICAPDPFTGMYPRMIRHFDGLPLPRAWWTISVAPFDHRLTRTGEKEIELEVNNGQMLSGTFERLCRSAAHPMKPGDAVDLGGFAVTVLEVGDQGPKRIRVIFAGSPESGRYQFLTYRDGALRRIALPEEGQSIDLPFVFP